jgi:predicted 2-oxoglutarate/Fe(II)-dependent dioxygenase YbiX
MEIETIRFDQYTCILIRNCLPKAYCDYLINELNEGVWTDAIIYNGFNYVTDKTVKKCKNIIAKQYTDLKEYLWSILKDIAPNEIEDSLIHSLCDKFSFVKYNTGDFFKPHFDRERRGVEGETLSKMTVQVYLNDEFEGGGTQFYDSYGNPSYVHIPKQGDILLFSQRLEHSGEMVLSGVKYSMRCEIMYI